jgi:hypothetical protein
MGAPANFEPLGGTDGRGARSELRHHRFQIRFHAIEQQREQFFDRRSNAGTGGIKDACGLSDSFAVC